MNYFQISSEPDGNILPCIVKWMEKLDYHAVQRGEFYKLPRRTLLYVENHPETVFADVLEAPFLLVSDMVWEVMQLYDGNVAGKEIILLDDIFGQTAVYHIPILKVWQGPLPEKWEGKAPPFFRAKEGCHSMIGRLDFVESILRRGAKGIRLREIAEEEK